jgi:hypothetical protein
LSSVLEQVGLGNHLAWVYNNSKQRLFVAVPFVSQALEDKAKAVVVGSQKLNEELIGELKEVVNVNSYREKGELEFLATEQLSWFEGDFSPKDLVSGLRDMAVKAKADGWKGSYIVVEPYDLYEFNPDISWWIEAEGLLDQALHKAEVKVLCQYNASRIPNKLLSAIIKLHPVVGMGSNLSTNPFYLSFEEYQNQLPN